MSFDVVKQPSVTEMVYMLRSCIQILKSALVLQYPQTPKSFSFRIIV